MRTTATTITGLAASTTYSFSIVPYAWNTAETETYNYGTIGTLNGITTSASATVLTISTNLNSNATITDGFTLSFSENMVQQVSGSAITQGYLETGGVIIL